LEAKILNGKILAKKILDEIKEEVKNFSKKPKLALVLVGDNEASKIYVKRKILACKKVGIESLFLHLDKNISQRELEEKILSLNKDQSVDGIMVQLPLPEHLDSLKIQSLIDPYKDVDGLGQINCGKLFLGQNGIKPATALGVIKLLEFYNLDLEGKLAMVIGRSNIVGKPLALLLLEKNATVLIAHSKTKNLEELTKLADFLFVAVGKPNFINGEMIKKGSVVIDIGINRIKENGVKKIVGDVDFNSAKKIAAYISPVPGGVGPLTVAFLLYNTILAYKLRYQKN
jgi:methylenetetrahydrofolate dehydrogenase (NADP+)/methenyltetrahydrofolate cyclohydrolase